MALQRRQQAFPPPPASTATSASGSQPLESGAASTTAATAPADDGSNTPDGKASLWKYALVVIFLAILVICLLRLALLRQRRRAAHRQHLVAQRPSNPQGRAELGALPPYIEHVQPPPRTRSRWSLILSPRPSSESTREPPAPLSPEEQRRRRLANIEIRQALIDAGLLLGPTRSRTRSTGPRGERELRAVAEEMLAEEERVERLAREERRARREARRIRRRDAEEGAGLPAYSVKAGGGEEVLEMGEGITARSEGRRDSRDSWDEDSDEDDGHREQATLLRTLDYAANLPPPSPTHPRS